jgi:hypothetical protein
MSREHTYTKGSWELVTQEIKAHFGWKTLTEKSAYIIMQMYLKGVKVENMIKQLEEIINELAI